MAKIYFSIIDTTKPNDSIDHAWYGCTNYMNDLAGHIMCFSRHNGTSPNDIRMYIFEKKQIWDKMRTDYAERLTKNIKLSNKC